jgi:hypothetical protein
MSVLFTKFSHDLLMQIQETAFDVSDTFPTIDEDQNTPYFGGMMFAWAISRPSI